MIVYDILKRYLRYKGFKVKHVMNITDVDDKTIKGSKKEKKTLKEFTEFYTKSFLDDIKTLNIEKADIMPKATKEINAMVKIIKKLLDKKYAYKTDNGDIYFKISKFKNYGKLALLDLDKLKQNADGRLKSDEYKKKDARDFALWKVWDKEDGDVYWKTEIGKGRPGWHIECSAMSAEYLGQPFDIHMGGVDLIFPHHTNEIAQSEAAYGKKFCNFWIHNDHLLVNGEKMSKSLGNFFTLKDLLDKDYDIRAIRYELLTTHYRQKLDFREDNLKNVMNTLNKFYDFMDKLDDVKGKGNKNVNKLIKKAEEEFEKAMDDDLNISGALAAIFTFMTELNKIMDEISKKDADNVKKVMMKFDSVIGVMQREKEKIPKEIMDLVKKREEARRKKDFKEADKIRDNISKKDYFIEDGPDGPRVKKS